MFKKNYLIYTLTILFAILMVAYSLFSEKKNQQPGLIGTHKAEVTNGPQDRTYWADLLYKISYPVIHNLAEGSLKKNMPLETSEGYGMQAGKVSHLEAVGRTMAGVAPWLALPDDNSKEGEMRKKLRGELLKGIANAVNPQRPDYLNFRTETQPNVDAGCMAHDFLLW